MKVEYGWASNKLQGPGRNAYVTVGLLQDVSYRTTMRVVDSLQSSGGGRDVRKQEMLWLVEIL